MLKYVKNMKDIYLQEDLIRATVLGMIIDGATSKDIAKATRLSERTLYKFLYGRAFRGPTLLKLYNYCLCREKTQSTGNKT